MKYLIRTTLIIVYFYMLASFCITTGFAAEQINTSTTCSILLEDVYNNKALPNVSFSLYKIADISAGGHLTYTENFSDCEIGISNSLTSSEWNAIKETLSKWIQTTAVLPDKLNTTDKYGRLLFDSLSVGVYFISAEQIEIDSTVYECASTLIAIPGQDVETGNWMYDITIEPKNSASYITGGGDGGGDTTSNPVPTPVPTETPIPTETPTPSTTPTPTDNEPPENPGNPLIPDNPDSPNPPSDFETPDMPDEPDNPNEPGNPDSPDEPETPDTPDNPGNPNIPQTGQLKWPVPVFIGLGCLLILTGLLLTRKGKGVK